MEHRVNLNNIMKHLLAVLVLVVLSVNAIAEDEDEDAPLSESEMMLLIQQALYSDLASIEYFGTIGVFVTGDSAEQIGLDADDLTDYLKLRFKNNFASIPYKDKSESYDALFDDEEEAAKFGEMMVSVWVIGEDYPIVYHIEIDVGAFTPGGGRYENAHLGYGTEESVPDTIRESIGSLVEDAAVTFFKVRGEL